MNPCEGAPQAQLDPIRIEFSATLIFLKLTRLQRELTQEQGKRVDHYLLFFEDDLKDPKRALIQVKSGKVGVKDLRDFRGVVECEGATLGLFVSLEPPTRDMVQEAAQAGVYTTPLGNLRIPRLQIRTVEELLGGEGFAIPSAALLMGVAQAERVAPTSRQKALEM